MCVTEYLLSKPPTLDVTPTYTEQPRKDFQQYMFYTKGISFLLHIYTSTSSD